MAAPIQPKYYRDAAGNQPVDQFIDKLAAKHQETIDNQIDRIKAICTTAHPDLPFPHSSSIDGPLRELRCHYGKHQYRILYRRSGNFAVLLHIIYKTTKTVPPADIAIAQARWNDFKARMDAEPRVPPRALGRDAP